MLPQRPPRPSLTVDEIFAAFPEGVFGLKDALAAARFAGHGSGSFPPGLTQIDLGFGDIRVQTSRDHRMPTSLVAGELVFHWLSEAEITFPLTLTVDRREHRIVVDEAPTAFDTFTLGGQAVAVATVHGVGVTIRCAEPRLESVEVIRFDRAQVEEIARSLAPEVPVAARVWPQPMIVVRNVPASSRFYAEILQAESAHGGEEYEQLVSGGELILQLHSIDVEHHHGALATKDVPLGNGALVWFEVSDFDAAVARVRSIGAVVERDVHVNPNAKQAEIWLRDPDGYLVVLAGASEYRPRT